ncbi:MAG: hypothetical protein JWN32_2182 [Solirubrobacterales bacterium]|nr:hypothetical protein [Solirubrobacterales bacterium]
MRERGVRPLFPLLALAAALLLLAGCGGGVTSPDLFVVTRTGQIPGARLTMLVNDGGYVTCNGHQHQLPSARLLDARDLLRTMKPYAKTGLRLAPGRQSVLAYRVRTEFGTLSFADDSRGIPAKLFEMPLFVRQVAIGVCGLAR